MKVTNKILKTVVKIDYEIKGSQNITSNNVIYACQHQSAWDTIIIPYLIGDCIIFHKRSLLFIPFFGWHLFKLGMIIITRNKGANNLRKIIEENNIDISSIEGTGKAGRISKGDLINLMGNIPETSKEKLHMVQKNE